MIALFFLMAISIVTVSSKKDDNYVQDLKTDKIDEHLKEMINTRTSDSKLSVIVVLNEQPAHDISIKVKKGYKKDLEDIADPARQIYSRIKPIRASQKELKTKTIDQLIANEQSLLTNQEKAELKIVGQKIDSKRKEMRRDILGQTTPLADRSQKPLIAKIEAKGGKIKYSSKIYNAIVADIPASYIEDLSRDRDIYMIYNNNVLTASLDISTQAMGANTWWDNGYNGSSTDVAIIDTGIDATHPNLSVAYAGVFHEEGMTDSSYYDNSSNPDDFQGHGTHVAGIVASNDATYRGVGYGIDKLINAKAGWKTTGGSGAMYLSDGMEAINWSIYGNEDDADVISYSFGGPPEQHSEFEHFLDAISFSLDIPVVVAAGNSGSGPHTVGEPANAFNILAVGNIDDKNTANRSDDEIRSSSSRGPAYDGRVKPDISAPGTSIFSTNNNWETQDDFVSMTGTSMAAPHIAGAVLLILDYMNARWQPEAIKALLMNTAEDKGAAGPDNSYGYGYVDLSNAYMHRDDVLNGSINNTPDGSVEKFYRGTAYEGDRATLVWNRHIIYNGIGPYDRFSNLYASDLDLYMYNETSGSQISLSISGINNSEQVKSNADHSSIILKIDPYGTFPDGIISEDYALATEGGFSEVSPPVLNVNVSNSESVNGWDTFDLYVNVTNNGGIIAHNVSVNITAPDGFSIISGANPQFLGSINNGSSIITSWVLKAPRLNTSASFTQNISAISLSYNESFSGEGTNTIWVNGDGYINGTVFNDTGILGAIVTADSGDSTTTNESGFYLIQVPPGSNNLTVTREPEYYPNSSILVNAISGATVVQDVEILEKPNGTISGTVINS